MSVCSFPPHFTQVRARAMAKARCTPCLQAATCLIIEITIFEMVTQVSTDTVMPMSSLMREIDSNCINDWALIRMIDLYNAITDTESWSCAYWVCLYICEQSQKLFHSFIGQNCRRSASSYSLVWRDIVMMQQIVAPHLKLFEIVSKLCYL